MRRLTLAALVLAAPACRADTAEPPPSPPVTAPVMADDAGTAGPTSIRKRVGVAHAAAIDAVALSSDGISALSRDTLGSVRLWPALDGSEEPMVVPVAGATHMSVEPHAEGWTVAIVEPSGGGRILDVDRQGKAALRTELVPFEPVKEIHVRPGGQEAVVLFLDHQVLWMDADGGEIARYGERRFRPGSLQLTNRGHTVGAVITESADPEKVRGEVQRLELRAGDAPSIEPLGSPRIFESRRGPGLVNVRLSPDGNRLAVLGGTRSKWTLDVLSMGSDQKMSHELPLPAHQEVSIGWVGGEQIMASGSDGNLSWLFDLERGETLARSAEPQHLGQIVASVRAHGPGRQISGRGSWLFVHDETRGEHFLGYDAMDTRTAAISSSHVAWGYPQGDVYVEDLAGHRPPVRLRPGFTPGLTQLFFLDDDHLATVDTWGGISVYHWASGRIVTQGSAGGMVRAFDFDPEQGLLALTRHNGDVRVFDLSAEDGMAGPYIVPLSTSAAGLWRDETGGPERSVLWAMEGTRLLTFTLEELRRGVSREGLEERREKVTALPEAPRAIDRTGTRYIQRWDGGGQTLEIVRGEETRKIALGAASVSQVLPAPAGGGFVTVSQSGQQHFLAHFQRGAEEPDWTFSTGAPFASVGWSPDGRHVVLASATGGVVLDDAGKVVASRCGFGFQARGSATTTSASPFRPICEQP